MVIFITYHDKAIFDNEFWHMISAKLKVTWFVLIGACKVLKWPNSLINIGQQVLR